MEEAAMFLASLFLVQELNLPWKWFWILFLAPDLGMLGYLVNNRTGAITYNLLHHKGIAVLIFIIGANAHYMQLELIGTILFAHSSFDRMLGYGLKYADGFHSTHLGLIGKKLK